MRADLYLTAQGYFDSRSRAQNAIAEGRVFLDGASVPKPSFFVDETTEHTVVLTAQDRYVSRGGYKLEGALRAFGIDCRGVRALDVGASTGGFTDCLLQNGASEVIALDVGTSQLHERLRRDGRVRVMENFNARALTEEVIGGKVDRIVMDVSFISQTCILPALSGLLTPDGCLISLIKPQFEAGKGAIGKGGIVKNAADRLFAAERVIECARVCGLRVTHFCLSPIKGGDGNIEYLACFVPKGSENGQSVSADEVRKTVLSEGRE